MSKYFLLFFSTTIIHSACFAQQVTIQNLLCESVNSPLAIDTKLPRLSWQLQSQLRNILQAAYQILVASTPEKLKNNTGDLWDSKKQISGNSILIAYNGSTLKSMQTCYWKVKVWANNGTETPWSHTASWEMGLLNKNDWQAEWIGYDGIFSEAEKPNDRFTRVAARYARKDFTVPKNIKKAIAYISGVGLYELYLNGNKICNQVMAPGPADYAKRVFYNTFDVTAQLKNGNNAAGVILGNGRFVAIRQHLEDTTNNCVNYGFPKLLMQLQITFEDGSMQLVKTDSSWMISGDGPIIVNNEFDGEEYDATKEFKDWAKPGFTIDNRWKPVQLTTAAAPVIQSQLNPPITIAQTMKPQSVTEPKPGMFVFNMAQNMVGWVQLKVSGARGTKVSMRFAERLEEDGTIYTGNLGDARVTDIYTLKGEGIEIWEPRFTYHGFQYVEVTGFPGTPTLENMEGKVVHDNMEVIGKIETSNEVLNKIYHNMYWGIRSNYRGMPTDCPQRDERMGWLGDRAAVGKGESFMFNTQLLYAKWMQDIEDAQNEAGSIPDVAPAYWRMYTNNTTWPSAYVYNIDMLYQQFGNAEPIQRHYASIKKWLDFLKSHFMQEGIITENTYGDWCVPPETLTLIFSNDPNRKTPGDYLSTAFYYDMLNIMVRFAGITNNKNDIAFFKEEAKKTKTAFNKKFFNSTGNYYANNTTTANVLALAFNLVPGNLRKEVFARIVDKTMNEGKGHITTGLIGIQQLMRTLTHNGRPDIAYLLATTTSYPSWGYMLTQGATTIWELWNGNTAGPAMNSANHVMMIGDLLTWYYEDLAGIKAAAPAFKIIEMKPIAAPDLKFVHASYQCPQGLIVSNRSMDEKGFKWQIEIPANTKAVVYIPASPLAKIKENGRAIHLLKDIKQVGKTREYVLLEIGSGKYNFNVE